MTTSTYRPYPSTRRVVRDALGHYRHGLTMAELRRRCSKSGLVHAVEDNRNVSDEFDAVLEYLIDEQLVEQRVIAGGVRYVDALKYPATTTDQESETTA